MDEMIPRFCSGKMIRARVAPVSLRALRSWARQGFVRTAKLGESRQSPVLYCAADVLALLDQYADGRQPVRRRR
jgi:hypothetical protein